MEMVFRKIKQLVVGGKNDRINNIKPQKFDLERVALGESIPLMSGESVITTLELEDRILQIKLKTKATDANFKIMYEDPILRLAEAAQLSPASEAYHHYELGGFIAHTLEVVEYALSERNKYFLPEGVSLEEQLEGEHRWTYGVFICALLHDVGKLLTQHTMVLSDGDIFTPFSRFKDFVKDGEKYSSYQYNLHFNKDRAYESHQFMGGAFLAEFFSYRELIWISSDKLLFESITEYLSGHASETASFSKIVSAADSRSTGDSLKKSELSPFVGSVASKQENIWKDIRRILQGEIENGRHHNSGSMLKLDGEYIYIQAERLRIEYAALKGIPIPIDSDKKEKDLFVKKLTQDFSDTAQFMYFTNNNNGVLIDGIITSVKYFDQSHPEGMLWRGQMVVKRSSILGLNDTHPTLTQISRGLRYILPIDDVDMLSEYIVWRQEKFKDHSSFAKEASLSLSGMKYYLEHYKVGSKLISESEEKESGVPVKEEAEDETVAESSDKDGGNADDHSEQSTIEEDPSKVVSIKQAVSSARKRQHQFNGGRNFKKDSGDDTGGAKEDKKPVEQKEDKKPVEQKEDKKPVEQKKDKKPLEQKKDKKPLEQKKDKKPLEQEKDKPRSLLDAVEEISEEVKESAKVEDPAPLGPEYSGADVSESIESELSQTVPVEDSAATPDLGSEGGAMQMLYGLAGFDDDDELEEDMKISAKTSVKRRPPKKNGKKRSREQIEHVKKEEEKELDEGEFSLSSLREFFKSSDEGVKPKDIVHGKGEDLNFDARNLLGKNNSSLPVAKKARLATQEIVKGGVAQTPDFNALGLDVDLELNKEDLVRRMKVPLSKDLEVKVDRVIEQAINQDRYTFSNITAMLKDEGVGVLTHTPYSKKKLDRAEGLVGKDDYGDPIRSVYAWDIVALPYLSEEPSNEEYGVVFLQWLAVVIYSRKYEVNGNRSPIHKIGGQYLTLTTPVLLLEFLADYGLYVIPEYSEKDERETYNKDVSGVVRGSIAKTKIGGRDISLFQKNDKGTKLGKNIFNIWKENSRVFSAMLIDIRSFIDFIESNEDLNKYLDNSFRNVLEGLPSNTSFFVRDGVFK